MLPFIVTTTVFGQKTRVIVMGPDLTVWEDEKGSVIRTTSSEIDVTETIDQIALAVGVVDVAERSARACRWGGK